ncbi:bifunctional 5,10-methylenetetrahydrofolate dehydrogenase/5,10-methenyltetrahydrofolate cyclohydrolase [Patescibacteria group bacterium]
MKLIDGKKLANELHKETAKEIEKMFRVPGLAIVLIGDDPASRTYVGLKEEYAEKIGMHFEKYVYPENVDQEVVLEKVEELNEREEIHGIVVQLPLPDSLDTNQIISSITPEKDVDGFHPDNVEMVLEGREHIMPSLIKSILYLADSTGFTFRDSTVVILANSKTFASPLASVLHRRKMDVAVVLPPFADFEQKTQKADLIIIAIGKPRFLKGNAVKKGAHIIDVGFTRGTKGVVGDVDQKSVKDTAGWLTPVPGGVGPMTVATLLSNTVEACKLQTS